MSLGLLAVLAAGLRLAGVARVSGVARSRLGLAGVSRGLVAVLITTTGLRRRSRVDNGSSLSRGNGVSVRRAGGRNGVSVRGCAGRGNGVGVA